MSNMTGLPGRPIPNRGLAAQLCSRSPRLRAARRLHLDRYGKLIPHLFMGDVLARVGACAPALADEKAANRPEVDAILRVLELGARIGENATRDVIAVSFVDDGAAEPFFPALLPLLGPNLRAQVPPAT